MSKKLNIFIERTEFFDDTTIGKLYMNENYFCWTLEDAVRAYGVKVYGKTAIPAGKYKAKVTYSPKFKRDMLMLYTENDGSTLKNGGISFSGVRIHGGNDHEDSHGCPLICYNRPSKKRIQGSAEKEFTAKCKEYDEIIVDITNNVFE